MVQVTQTEEDIKIIIELNRLITRKPDVVLLPCYLKFNNPPIFFERHLMHEIDEVASFCRIFKKEARIILIKRQKGIWPEIFQKLSKEELMQKRIEISNLIIERNKERDQKALERYEHKRRAEIDKEVKRETAMRDRVKQFEESACREALSVGIVPKEAHVKPQKCLPSTENRVENNDKMGRLATPVARPRATPLAAVRSAGKINVSFSSFALRTPKRESQESEVNQFLKSREKFEAHQAEVREQSAPMNTVNE